MIWTVVLQKENEGLVTKLWCDVM